MRRSVAQSANSPAVNRFIAERRLAPVVNLSEQAGMIDPSRLADLFALHAAPLALYARQFASVDADELVQEAFIRLLGQPAEPPEVRPWLLTTVRHLAIDRQRSWFRRRRRERAVE